MQFERIDAKHNDLSVIRAFLRKSGLGLDAQIDYFIVGYHDSGDMAVCGGLAGNIIKCVAIDESLRGDGVALKLATELVNLAYELKRPHLFIYTKPEYALLFKSCGFYTISDALPYVVLLENSATRLQKQCALWQTMRVAGNRIGTIVMNANPFTLGHRYLIEQALQQCDHLHLFVVGEDASQFSYTERFALVKQGIADLSDITLHSGSDYIISRATFPNYFLKDQTLTDDCYLPSILNYSVNTLRPPLASPTALWGPSRIVRSLPNIIAKCIIG
ncbi:[Citrate [pro-3S]-lyase] ligase [Aggregatibacter aphrophilus]|uniref:[Citrate [pro-3S]-lyase] ligase n=1 Tax=Aggregatibacter aphrophilus TaxID=732 RepID=A0A336N7L5_AGGAP|nr:[Citrate [pro-3S]-lyase] ligase [Aggregatibacter aphrophilus]